MIQLTALNKKVKSNPKALSTHTGPNVENHELDAKIYGLLFQRREAEIVILTAEIIVKASSVESGFKEEKYKLSHSVYPSLAGWKLSCKMATRVDQNLCGHLLTIREKFVKSTR